MDLLVIKITSLFLYILIGFIAGKYLDIPIKPISKLLLYTVVPATILLGVLNITNNPELLLLPFLICLCSSIISIITYYVYRSFSKKEELSIISFSSGTSNTGYFGVPLLMGLLGDYGLLLGVLISVGIMFYESTTGLYLLTKAHFTPQQALHKIVSMPHLYVLIIGCILITLPIDISVIKNILDPFKSAFSVLGMMVIGIALSQTTLEDIDIKLISHLFINKYILFPLCFYLFTAFILVPLHIISPEYIPYFIVLGFTPLAGNTINYAQEMGLSPNKLSISILISSVVSCIIIPLIAYIVLDKI